MDDILWHRLRAPTRAGCRTDGEESFAGRRGNVADLVSQKKKQKIYREQYASPDIKLSA